MAETATQTNGHMEKSTLLPNAADGNMRRNKSYGNMLMDNQSEARVLVIYTGGTIGMMRNKRNVLTPIPNALVKCIRRYRNMHDKSYAKMRFVSASKMTPLVLPYVQDQDRRIIYQITEYNPILDSSSMTISDWAHIAKDIHEAYEFFDGFVVLHGTDTLSYTACALSFMFENLGKTVIITGSQIPIFETRTDGADNFTSALIIAGNYVIPEVCVLFGNKLLRGNRTVKVSADSLEAFHSPNVPPLGHIGINVEIDFRLIFRPYNISRFTEHSQFDENVGLLRLFPSISLATIRAFLAPPIRGVVLQSFGAGNVPSNREDLMNELKAACDRGVIIVNCTQCAKGSVAPIYEAGEILCKLGVLPGFDMTPEAALAKLSYVLGKEEWDFEYKKEMMQTNLRGELTAPAGSNMQEYDLVDAVARSLHLSSPSELEQLGATLFPAMVNSAVIDGDVKKLNNLKAYGADLSGVNQDRRTALHLACHKGNYAMVHNLLLNGVSVQIRDSYDRTPLMEAISTDRHDIIELMLRCGAHLTGSSRAIGQNLCMAADAGMLQRLKSYKLAGADLSQPDISGRTALHLAALHGHVEIVDYLLAHMEGMEATDMLGFTALEYAQKAKQDAVKEILQNKSTQNNV